MENTLENKAKLLAQYWGQEVYIANKVTENIELHEVSCTLMGWISDQTALLLRSVDSITQRDAYGLMEVLYSWGETEMLDIMDIPDWLNDVMSGNCAIHADYVSGDQVLQLTDFLRSKGYALPYNGLSVDDLISYGWVKLKDE